MYSGGSSRVLPGGWGDGPKPDRLKKRRNWRFRLCMSTLLSCRNCDGSTTPPCPSPSPGSGRCLWWALEMGLLSPQRGPWSSRMENSKNKVLELQMVPSSQQMLAMGETVCSTWFYASPFITWVCLWMSWCNSKTKRLWSLDPFIQKLTEIGFSSSAA